MCEPAFDPQQHKKTKQKTKTENFQPGMWQEDHKIEDSLGYIHSVSK
jgi:hypothetical protein